MAGIEERLSKLEKILNRLFCCDTNEFTGPQGPQGPMGIPGPQGPPGADGQIIFQNLNWLGEFVSCVVYNQFDAVSYNGSSYFLNCENSTGFECESPIDNPCWVLLANAGAQGPQGLPGNVGNDGSNSGRWVLSGTGLPSLDPGATYFSVDNLDLTSLTKIIVSGYDVNEVLYLGWWEALYNFVQEYNPLVFIQITQVGSNDVLGIYKLKASDPHSSADIIIYPSWAEIGLDPIYVANATMNTNSVYTISWSIHGKVNSTDTPKTEGTITPVYQPGPYPILEFDYNNLEPQPVYTVGTSYFAALPEPTFIGQTLVVRALGTNADYLKTAGIVSHDESSIISINNGLTDRFSMYPQSANRFTWAGTYWILEDIQGFPTLFNNFKLADTYYNIVETVVDGSTSSPTKAYLNATYPVDSYPKGVKVYCPNIGEGPRVFTRFDDGSLDWASYPFTIVI